MNQTLDLARGLISRRSVTPEDGGCQALIAKRLEASGFVCEPLPFGKVSNLWARRGVGRPLFCFAGHTDVVPPGPLAQWQSDPFEPVVRDGRLYGRGAADMKTSIAAFVTAAESFVRERPGHSGSIALLLTSDEEGLAVDGTVRVVETLRSRREVIDFCIVGEPSSVNTLGDVVKNGRRGSLSARMTVHGLQGHIAYPHLARNPIHLLAPALAELATIRWDEGNAFFPPTSWQVSSIRAGAGANNIIPGELDMEFNFRYSTASTDASLRDRLEGLLRQHGLDYSIDWWLSGRPFLTTPGPLVEAIQTAVATHTGISPELSTSGGTSDGRFIADICREVVELGPENSSIHKVNEHVDLATIEKLPRIYLDVLRTLLS